MHATSSKAKVCATGRDRRPLIGLSCDLFKKFSRQKPARRAFEPRRTSCSMSSGEISSVHLLPCKIAYDGPAPVSSFFTVQTNDKEGHTAYLRGRELKGTTVDLGETCVGVITVEAALESSENLSASSGNDIEKPSKVWQCDSQFNSINIWQHDISPDTHQVEDALAWFDLAKRIHVD